MVVMLSDLTNTDINIFTFFSFLLLGFSFDWEHTSIQQTAMTVINHIAKHLKFLQKITLFFKIFSTLFSLVGNVMKYCFSGLIYSAVSLCYSVYLQLMYNRIYNTGALVKLYQVMLSGYMHFISHGISLESIA